MFDENDTITRFGSPVLIIQCERCKRHGQMQIHNAVTRYGDVTVGEWKKRVAEDGVCPFVAEGDCMAFVHQTSVTAWAKLFRCP